MSDAAPRVLILGADGFIGRHIAFAFRDQGADVIVSARRVSALRAMGFQCLAADLARPECQRPDFWRPHLQNGRAVINAAGLLTGSERQFRAVHELAPQAVYAAQEPGAGGILISAIGIDDSATPFARWRRQGEALAAASGLTILRPGLVMADTSYGGTSLARALAALPGVTPVVGSGAQVFNPIHAADLAQIVAACLTRPPGPGAHEIGGPERLGQAELLGLLRRWLGLAPARLIPLPVGFARLMGRVGDALRLGPISATAVDQLQTGVEADAGPLTARLGITPRGVSRFVMARPAGTQDLWHARLYLLKPMVRLTLALLWAVSGLIGLLLPPEAFLPLLGANRGPEALWVALARLGGLADLAIALALIRNWRPRLLAWAQIGLVLGYTMAFTLLAPILWLLPLGGLLKNLPILMLIGLWAVLERER